jgi:DNA-binding CsgD family transcriptional regulator
MSLYWLGVFVIFDSGANAVPVGGLPLPLLIHLIALCANAAGSLLIPLARRWVLRVVWSKPVGAAVLILSVLGTALTQTSLGGAQLALAIIGSALYGLATPWFSIAWGLLYRVVSKREVLPLTAATFVIATFGSYLASLLPQPAIALVGVVSMGCSFGFAIACHARQGDAEPAGAPPSRHGAYRVIPTKTVVGLAGVLFVYAAGRSIIFLDPAYSYDMHIPMLATAVAFLVGLFFLQSARLNLNAVYRMAIVAVAVASVLVALSLANHLRFASALAAMSIILIEIATWILMVGYARPNPILAVAVFGLGRGIIHLGSALGEAGGLFLIDLPMPYLIIAVVVSILAAGFFFKDSDMAVGAGQGSEGRAAADDADDAADDAQGAQAAAGSPKSPTGRAATLNRAALLAVKRAHGLSQREVDIVELWATGYSSAHIERELVISKSTVKTHVKHIYEKTGVHSKAELINLINALSCH